MQREIRRMGIYYQETPEKQKDKYLNWFFFSKRNLSF